MKTKIIFYCLICFAFSVLALAGDFDFYNPWAAYGSGCYYQPTTYSQDYVPYFAMHPPVYYSYPIARTYGDSPFPYPPGMMAFLAYSPSPQPKITRNEHIEEANQPTDEQYQTHLPLRIPNPFVEQSDSTYMSKGVNWAGKQTPKPLVVYPASLARQIN